MLFEIKNDNYNPQHLIKTNNCKHNQSLTNESRREKMDESKIKQKAKKTVQIRIKPMYLIEEAFTILNH